MQSSRFLSVMAFASLVSLVSPVSAKESKARTAEPRAYVETSHLIAPRNVGDFVLESSRYDDDAKYSGAGFRYVADGHPETRIDVYVYPAGRMSPTIALAQGMDAFRTDLASAVEARRYAKLVMGDEQEIRLDDTTQLDRGRGESADEDELLAIISSAGRQEGRKLRMTFNLLPQDWPMHSSGYLFYKQLYYFKVRTSAAQANISAEEFEALSDRAANALVRAIDVFNIGHCANAVITIPVDASPQEGAKALVMQTTEHRGYNCHASADGIGLATRIADAEMVKISYEPLEWKSE